MPSNQEGRRAGAEAECAGPCVQSAVRVSSVLMIHFRVLTQGRRTDAKAEDPQGAEELGPTLEGSGVTRPLFQ